MNQSMSIADLQERIVAFREARDWEQFHNPDLSISLVLEATELLEHFQWKNTEEMQTHCSDHTIRTGPSAGDFSAGSCENLQSRAQTALYDGQVNKGAGVWM